MRLDKFTTKFQQALGDAQSLAIGHDNQMIEPQHLLSVSYTHLDVYKRQAACFAPALCFSGRFFSGEWRAAY